MRTLIDNLNIMEQFSFKKGWSQVQQRDMKAVKREIMEALEITTRVTWYCRLYGKTEPKVSEAKAIEEIFAKYGVEEIWGVE
jgi:hypothetical protein